jgi:hypothetical protein
VFGDVYKVEKKISTKEELVMKAIKNTNLETNCKYLV